MEKIIRKGDSIYLDTKYPSVLCGGVGGVKESAEESGRQLDIEQLIGRSSKVVRDIDLSSFC